MPTEIVVDCLAGLVRAVERQARGDFAPRNYEEWMRGVFGDGIAEHLMIPYARKIWTVEPREMEFGWIDRRVPTPDVERIVAGAVSEDVGQVGATAHFWYPKRGGIEALPRARRARRRCPARTRGRADRRRRADRLLPGRRAISFDRMIYTLPLSELAALATVPARVRKACGALRYQGSAASTSASTAGRLRQALGVLLRGRVPVPPALVPGELHARERAARQELDLDGDRILRTRARSTASESSRVVEALTMAGILKNDERIELVHTQEIIPAYVIYDLEHSANVDVIRSWLAEHEIAVAGRFGEWQYLNMDHAMKSGREAARAVARSRSRPSVPRGHSRAARGG